MTQFKVKRGILLGSILFPLISLTAQNEWDDVRITHVNREEAHTLAIPFDGKKENVSPAIEKSPYYFSLNGKWKFNWVPTPDKKPENFFDPSYDVSQWDDIEVPCPWQIYGVRNQKIGTSLSM